MNDRDLRRISSDTYAPWTVRPALRPDPKPDKPAHVALCLLSFAVLGTIIAQAYAWMHP